MVVGVFVCLLSALEQDLVHARLVAQVANGAGGDDLAIAAEGRLWRSEPVKLKRALCPDWARGLGLSGLAGLWPRQAHRALVSEGCWAIQANGFTLQRVHK